MSAAPADAVSSAEVMGVDEVVSVGCCTWLLCVLGALLVQARSLQLDVPVGALLVDPFAVAAATLVVLEGCRRLGVRRSVARLALAAQLLVAWGWILQLRIDPASARTTALMCVPAALALVVVVALGGQIAGRLPHLDVHQVRLGASLAGGVAVAILMVTWAVGAEINGSRAWVKVGDQTFQPGELARIGLVLAAAMFLSTSPPTSRLKAPVAGALLGVAGAAVAVLYLQTDLSPALLLGVVLVGMVWLHHGRWYLAGSVVVGAVALWISYRFLQGSLGHVGLRLRQVGAPFEPLRPSETLPSQLGRALLAHRRGGLVGTGLGRGRAETVDLADADYIYAGAAEEFGAIGLLVLLVPAGVIAHGGWRIVRRSTEGAVQLFAGGLLLVLVAGWGLTLAGTVGLFVPHGGLAVPFLSNGGSALIASSVVLGLLVGIGSAPPVPVEFRQSTIRRPEDRAEMLARPAMAWVLAGLALTIALRPLPVGDVLPLPTATSSGRKAEAQADVLRAWEQEQRARGRIVVGVGEEEVVLARSWRPGDPPCDGWRSTPDRPTRCYPEDLLYSDVTGAMSGQDPTALEDVLAPLLVQCAPADGRMDRLVGTMVGASCGSGRDVRLTIDPMLQELARGQLGGRLGAVVAVDPRTGEIRALVSSPGYSVGARAEPDVMARPEAEAVADDVGFDPSTSLVRRTLLPAGSVIKLVTAAAAIEAGRAQPVVEAELAPFADLDGAHCGGTVQEILAQSCNTGIAALAARLPDGAIDDLARRLGFGAETDVDGLDVICSPLPVAGGGGPGCPPAEQDSLARRVAGLAYIPVTPMQIAMMTAVFANEGHAVAPRIVADAGDRRDLGLPVGPQGPEGPEIVAGTTAELIVAAMRAVTDDAAGGTAARAFGETGLDAGAKTGSPERSREGIRYEDGWTTSFAPADNPTLVVTVWLAGTETAPQNGATAAEVAAAVLVAGT